MNFVRFLIKYNLSCDILRYLLVLLRFIAVFISYFGVLVENVFLIAGFYINILLKTLIMFDILLK
ncbi:hypothetical protein BCY91_15315 [Pelobium manganitolerans]|uniref:Uncharacterized protein n=1 Tax=Pelobium manganitolerans TaxID=1842495 RepID=A0A419S9P4_9SPHI|nr:hypothetical protein BCY91_15315 [Pelobium manganitolerans]